MAISSSSEDEVAEDGGEENSQTSEAHEDQMYKQMEVLEDIKVLFSENQELEVDTVQNVEGEKVEAIAGGDLVEMGVCRVGPTVNREKN